MREPGYPGSFRLCGLNSRMKNIKKTVDLIDPDWTDYDIDWFSPNDVYFTLQELQALEAAGFEGTGTLEMMEMLATLGFNPAAPAP